MKLLTAIVAPDQVERVTVALDVAGLRVTTVTATQAPGMESGRSLQYKGIAYTDQRCARIEILVDDVDLDVAVALVAPAAGQPAEGVIVWVSAVEAPTTLRPLARSREFATQS
ncbi:MAG TPA: P-II family nitrogen regulator [Acidimicrobiales bacterium]|nr:P-II family nitrogen regulator [Acidimicrobiales bacterium]